MTYFNLLKPQTKEFIDALQKELDVILQNDFHSDFDVIKSALKYKFGSLKDSENVTELDIILSQIKKLKEIQFDLQELENEMLNKKNNIVQNIEKELSNW